MGHDSIKTQLIIIFEAATVRFNYQTMFNKRYSQTSDVTRQIREYCTPRVE